MSDKHMCDDDVYRNGTTIAMTTDLPKEGIQRITELLAVETGAKVDWHYVGGRGVIKTLGDPQVARDKIRRLTGKFLKVIE
jgi:hypothetical protein